MITSGFPVFAWLSGEAFGLVPTTPMVMPASLQDTHHAVAETWGQAYNGKLL